MSTIKKNYGDAIATAVEGTPIPTAFLAALIGLESGGNPNAKRFESAVLVHLFEVLVGRKERFGAIGPTNLFSYIQTQLPTSAWDSLVFTSAMLALDGLASSWGLTQIMGYHALEPGATSDPRFYAEPAACLAETIRLIKQFGEIFKLNLATDGNSLFTCWNTGSPTGKTFDPQYVPNGLVLMGIYESLNHKSLDAS
jgi:hypothetical protein